MFERFTSDARVSVKDAQDEARQLRDQQIRPEHVLIALARGDGEAGQVLQSHGLEATDLRCRLLALTDGALDADALALLGIDLEAVRRATEVNLGPGVLDRVPRPPLKEGHLRFSKEAKRLLELSLREAVALKSGEISSGHLLLGILRSGDGLAVQLLGEARVDTDVLRAEVISLMTAKAA